MHRNFTCASSYTNTHPMLGETLEFLRIIFLLLSDIYLLISNFIYRFFTLFNYLSDKSFFWKFIFLLFLFFFYKKHLGIDAFSVVFLFFCDKSHFWFFYEIYHYFKHGLELLISLSCLIFPLPFFNAHFFFLFPGTWCW